MNIVEKEYQNVESLCQKYKVKDLYLFGSILTEKFNKKSDIDFLIQFQDVELFDYFDNFMGLKEDLEKLFKRNVDLVENQAVKNPIFRKVLDREKRLIYERKNS